MAKKSIERLKRQDVRTPVKRNCLEWIAIILSYIIFVVFFPIAIFFSMMMAQQFERIIILRLGRVRGAYGPGIVIFLPCIDDTFRVDIRTDSFDVPAQNILTKDSVTIRVDAIVYYRIQDPIRSVIEVMDANRATEFLAQTTLRNVTGDTMLADLLSSRDELSREILRAMEEATYTWGVKVERVEIKEITMPKQLQRAMAAEQQATREAKAKIAAANGELQSSSMLREASETMAENPIALQLRYLQTLNTVSAEKNHTIIVPFPLDVAKKMLGISSEGKKAEKSSPDLEGQKDQVPENSIRFTDEPSFFKNESHIGYFDTDSIVENPYTQEKSS